MPKSFNYKFITWFKIHSTRPIATSSCYISFFVKSLIISVRTLWVDLCYVIYKHCYNLNLSYSGLIFAHSCKYRTLPNHIKSLVFIFFNFASTDYLQHSIIQNFTHSPTHQKKKVGMRERVTFGFANGPWQVLKLQAHHTTDKHSIYRLVHTDDEHTIHRVVHESTTIQHL